MHCNKDIEGKVKGPVGNKAIKGKVKGLVGDKEVEDKVFKGLVGDKVPSTRRFHNAWEYVGSEVLRAQSRTFKESKMFRTQTSWPNWY
jgi:hypothetical protein